MRRDLCASWQDKEPQWTVRDLCVSAFSLPSESRRSRAGLFSSALTLALATAIAGVSLHGLPARTHMFMFLVGLVPQCIGHTTYNWSLRWLPPGLVALIGLAEPAGAGLLAYFFLNEGLTVGKGFGGCLILAGICLATSRNIGK